ncbi:hypothetical protein [Piscinibacter sp.]|uniref:hypothetical protein n=1 Tax=Piscinibacter sp. TaxID=1903157 RepID=UPI002C55E418|nr:hypothetical protein [Albitalea sp.]HUG22794.1 hypothetical protein [Albitalea sp.]
MSATSITVHGSSHRTAPRLAAPIGKAVASVLATLSSWLQPRAESPAEAAERLRSLANQYSSQPSFAADLRAAADRHDNFGEG